jgi:uncharacterized protein
MEIWQIPVVFTIGVIAGFINTLAGGGSLLTLPMLIFLGLPTAVANGTNRLAIVVQSMFAVAGFRKKGFSDFKSSLLLSIPVLIGSVIGAILSIDVPDVLFKRILALIMLFVLGLILWRPTRWKNRNIQCYENITSLSWTRRITIFIIFLFVGIYGGYIQAGIGLIIIAILTTLSGLNLVETNSHKVFVIGISATVSLIVFVFYSKICWSIGLSLAAGNGLGGWIGSHYAVTKGERFIRQILVICVVGMVVKLLY